MRQKYESFYEFAVYFQHSKFIQIVNNGEFKRGDIVPKFLIFNTFFPPEIPVKDATISAPKSKSLEFEFKEIVKGTHRKIEFYKYFRPQIYAIKQISRKPNSPI